MITLYPSKAWSKQLEQGKERRQARPQNLEGGLVEGLANACGLGGGIVLDPFFIIVWIGWGGLPEYRSQDISVQ